MGLEVRKETGVRPHLVSDRPSKLDGVTAPGKDGGGPASRHRARLPFRGRDPRRPALLPVPPAATFRAVSYEVLNPETLAPPKGWNHGMLAPAGGRLLFVAGQTGVEGSDGTLSDEWRQALANVMEVVRAAGGEAEDVGQLTIFVTDREEYLSRLEPIGEAYRSVMGRHFPAIALVEVSGLVDEGARVEVQAAAVIPE